MKYYFAYGSNMSIDQMKQRCPASAYIGNTELKGWRFFYNTRHYASIIEDKHAAVWGAIFKISDIDEIELDIYEGVATSNYYKKTIPLEGFGDVLTYIAINDIENFPYDNYHRHIIKSAQMIDIHQPHIKHISKLGLSGKISPRKYINE